MQGLVKKTSHFIAKNQGLDEE
ncbi:MAG: hypothetical protein K0R90_1777, partial [Oscillospiraceae bacterium]|nr:hypothetical protein [Oscillospiraceae bacterium]